ncbi:MAG: flap endonuclease-1 [Candidatus Hadarchaeota archaeon]
MGVQLGDIVAKHVFRLEQLRGKVIAVDAMNSLYQFLSIIRQRDGEMLRDSKGRITSHLSGLFYRTANFVEAGLMSVYVFDGQPPLLKRRTVEERKAARAEASVEWKKAVEEGRVEDARKFAQRAGRVDQEMVQQSKTLLDQMGIPWVQAPGEGEAQAALIVQQGDAWAAASQDFDSLLFGAPRLIRNLAITGRRKLPGKDYYVEVSPEVIELEEVLRELELTREQLVDIGILIGTDYNEGVKGIGPKKALELVRKHGSVAKMDDLLEKFEVDTVEVSKIFLEPNVSKQYKISWGELDPEGIIGFLCGEHDFSDERVQSGIDKLTRGMAERGQASIEKWFG